MLLLTSIGTLLSYTAIRQAGLLLVATFTTWCWRHLRPTRLRHLIPPQFYYQGWSRYGVAEDTFWLPATNWSFLLGTNLVAGLHVSSSGTLSFNLPKGSPTARLLPDGTLIDFLAPLQTHLGIVPSAGRFWHATTPSNTLLLTWQNQIGRASCRERV